MKTDGKEKGGKSEEKEAKPKDEKEPNFEMMSNPARVMKPQLKLLTMPDSARYRPVKEVTIITVVYSPDSCSVYLCFKQILNWNFQFVNACCC